MSLFTSLFSRKKRNHLNVSLPNMSQQSASQQRVSYQNADKQEIAQNESETGIREVMHEQSFTNRKESTPIEFGKVGEQTQTIRDVIERVTALGNQNSIEISEIREVITVIDTKLADTDDVFVCAAKTLLLQIVDDEIVSNEERRLLASFGKMYANPISNEPVKSVSGKAFVLTGDFATAGGKTTITDMIKAAGGEVKSGTSRKVSCVVVGELGSGAWAFGNFGQKVKKALDLKLTGKADINIVTEEALMKYFSSSSPEAMNALSERADRFERQWKSACVVSRDFEGLTNGQREVFELVKSGYNVYLTGLGGTGKSYIIKHIIEWAETSDRNVIVCAPTGIAALNVGGCTVHRALGIKPGKTLQMNPNPYLDKNSPLLECDLMIVDEISMCRMDLFDYLSLALKKAAAERARVGKIPCQLIVVGDFCQLPPVVKKDDKAILDQKYGYDIGNGYSFMGLEWDSWSFAKVELTEAIRQRDAGFVAALNACRVGDTNGLRWIEKHSVKSPSEKAIVLCGKNDQATRENHKRLDALPSVERVYVGEVAGAVEASDLPTDSELRLKVGARVMALANNSEKTFMNGSLGNVTQCNGDTVCVRFDNGYEGVINRHQWNITRPTLSGHKMNMEIVGTFTQIPLKLAYAITIHKAQGQTFEAASIYPRCWDPGQLYTALSRLTSISGLHLAHACPDSSLITSPDVLDFNEGRPIRRKPIVEARVELTGTDDWRVDLQPAENKNVQVDNMAAAPSVNKRATCVRASHSWTLEEEAFILANPTMTVRELATKFGVTPKAAERKRAKLRKAK